MGLADRDYMKTPPPEEKPPPRPSLWITLIAILVILSFLLSALI